MYWDDAYNIRYGKGRNVLLYAGIDAPGIGFSATFRAFENGDLRVDDCLNDESVSLNYVPALTMQHKYALLTLFPHEIKMAGETGGQFSLFGELPMGGKTGNPDVYKRQGNILSSIFSRGDNDRLSMVNQLDVNFEKEWRQGVSNTFGVQVRDLFSNPYVPFVKPDGELMPSIQSTIVRLNTRLSKDEIVVRKAFDLSLIHI